MSNPKTKFQSVSFKITNQFNSLILVKFQQFLKTHSYLKPVHRTFMINILLSKRLKPSKELIPTNNKKIKT